MVSTALRFVTVVSLVCALNGVSAEKVEHVNRWGHLNAQVILGSTKSKIGIPFLQRSIELAYPEVNFDLIASVRRKKTKNICSSSSTGF